MVSRLLGGVEMPDILLTYTYLILTSIVTLAGSFLVKYLSKKQTQQKLRQEAFEGKQNKIDEKIIEMRLSFYDDSSNNDGNNKLQSMIDKYKVQDLLAKSMSEGQFVKYNQDTKFF